ncbi:MAG: 50S ribosomal protein L29 [Acidobacteriota bacterium]
MKATKFRDLSDDELAREIHGLRKALFNLRVQQAIGQLEKPHQLSATRRDLARALTVQREHHAVEETQ